MRFYVLAFLLAATCFLNGCATTPEQKVNNIRAREMPRLEKELATKQLFAGSPVFIRIFKEEAVLELWMQSSFTGKYELFKTYGICAYSGRLGPKTAMGDMQTPEGFYGVTLGRLHPASKYHLAMNIGYPNKYDEAHKRTGSSLMIHGDCKSEGCFAMTSPYIEEIYLLVDAALRNGQERVPVHSFPFRMTPMALAMHPDAQWGDFWQNLQEGYDYFELSHIPPAVDVSKKHYIFAQP